MWIFVIIIILIAIVVLKNISTKRKVASGGYDNSISELLGYYHNARIHYKELGADVISVSTYWFEMDGKIDSSSAYMSVCLRDGVNDELAESLGMQVQDLCGKKYYQFVVKGKFSKTVKKEIIQILANKISEAYTNDLIEIDKEIPALYSLVDCKDEINSINQLY